MRCIFFWTKKIDLRAFYEFMNDEDSIKEVIKMDDNFGQIFLSRSFLYMNGLQ